MIKGMELAIIPIDQILSEDRARENYGNIRELVESFKKEGIIQPIAVRRLGPDKYKLLAGGRRYMAAQQAKLTELPCRIYTEDLSVLEMKFIELSENLYRKELEWCERCKLDKEIYTLMEQMHGRKISTAPDAPGVSKTDVAEMLGRSIQGFAENIRMAEILEAMPEIASLPTQDDARKFIKSVEKDMVRKEIAAKLTEERTAPIDKQLADLASSYIVQDFFEGVKCIPDNSIDIVELDPPYAIDLKGVKKMDTTKAVLHGYNEIDTNEYPFFIDRVVREAYRVLKDGGWIIQWFGPDPWFEIVYSHLVKRGFSGIRIPAIWTKQGSTGQTMQPDTRLGSAFEMFFYMKKNAATIKKQGRPNVFSYPVVPADKKIHPTERPVELIQEILETFTIPGSDTRVLVPFAGSGNTLLAASNLGMTVVGFDLTQAYKDAFVIRVYDKKPGLYRSYIQNLYVGGQTDA